MKDRYVECNISKFIRHTISITYIYKVEIFKTREYAKVREYARICERGRTDAIYENCKTYALRNYIGN